MTDVVTVLSLFKLVGLEIFAKLISVLNIVVVRVLLFLLFAISTTVSAVYVAVIGSCSQDMTERSIALR